MSAMPARVQNVLLEIKVHLGICNEEVEQARVYQMLTFEELPTENHRRVVGNYKLAEKHIADRARILAEKISELPELRL